LGKPKFHFNTFQRIDMREPAQHSRFVIHGEEEYEVAPEIWRFTAGYFVFPGFPGLNIFYHQLTARFFVRRKIA